MLHPVMVAPITSTIRDAPGEVPVGVDEGLKGPSAVNLDHVQAVGQSRLHHCVGTLLLERMRQVCRAPMLATACSH